MTASPITLPDQSDFSYGEGCVMKPDRVYIVDRLAELGKTQTALGKELKIDRAQVTRLLDGSRRVRLDEVETIARFLDISTIEMLRRLGLNL